MTRTNSKPGSARARARAAAAAARPRHASLGSGRGAFRPPGLVVRADALHECSNGARPSRGGSRLGSKVTTGSSGTYASAAPATASDTGTLAQGVQAAQADRLLHRSDVEYIDDLLCSSPTLEQHTRNVLEALAILRQEKLYIKASKCAFCREEVRGN